MQMKMQIAYTRGSRTSRDKLLTYYYTLPIVFHRTLPIDIETK